MDNMMALGQNPFAQIPVNQTTQPAGNGSMQQMDIYLVIDKSGSMSTQDMQYGQTRWKAAQESVFAVASKVFKFDPDGIDIVLFSNQCVWYRNVGPEKVSQVFLENDPMGGTRLAQALESVAQDFFAKRDTGKLKANGAMVLVVTDGQPDDREETARVVVNAANRLYPTDKLSINFIQIGYDKSATEFLKSLDTGLVRRGALRDIVATVNIDKVEEKGLDQVLLDTLNGGNR